MDAFPNSYETREGDMRYESGMTLRDYFAAKAMPVIITDAKSGKAADWAKVAYQMADAMLKARDA